MHLHRLALSSIKSKMGRLREDLRKRWEKGRGRMSDNLLFLELVMLLSPGWASPGRKYVGWL